MYALSEHRMIIARLRLGSISPILLKFQSILAPRLLQTLHAHTYDPLFAYDHKVRMSSELWHELNAQRQTNLFLESQLAFL
jgi:hypothetical protein